MFKHDPVTILQLTDTHIMKSSGETLLGVDTAYYFKAVLDAAIHSGRRFDLCLVTGDIAQDPAVSSYRYLLTHLQRLGIRCLCLPGNHDDIDIMRQVFTTDTINCNKQITLGNWQVLCLNSQVANSSGGYLSPEELSFLEDNLKTKRNLNTLIAVHHHCIASGSSWMDTMIIDNAPAMFDLLQHYDNAKVVINGHIHQAMDIQWKSCRILTTPSTCFQFKPHSQHFSLDDASPGYRWIDLYRDGTIDTDIVRIPDKITGLDNKTAGY